MNNPTLKTLFRDLGTLIEAGIPPVQAVAKTAPAHSKQWQYCLLYLEKGSSLAQALYKSQLISRFECEIVEIADTSGRLCAGLQFIAGAIDARKNRIQKVKFKLFFPFAVLLIAIIVSAILQLVQVEESSILFIILTAMFQMFFALLISRALLSLLQADACRLLQSTYVFHSQQWYKKLMQQVVFTALLWQIRSGIDFKSGFNRLARLFDKSSLKRNFYTIGAQCEKGSSVCQAINQSNLPITNDFKQLLLSAEHSGAWTSTVERQLDLQGRELDDLIERVHEWIPRIFYACVAAIAISVII